MMRKTLLTLATLLLMYLVWPTPVEARQRLSGWCEDGNSKVAIVGTVGSTTTYQRSFSLCTVTVYAAGTTNLSTIFSDNSGTALANPFTATREGRWFFYADNSRYDIKFSGGGISTPFTLGDFQPNDFAEQTWSYESVTFSATPTFDASLDSIFAMTLTGNVTSSTVSNAKTGRVIAFQLCQDATGGRTFAWPATFLRPPTIAGGASACTDASFFYDGTNWRPLAASGDNTQLRIANGVRFADQFSSIQAAINDLPSTGGEVFIPCGTYSSASAITISTNDVVVRGSGGCTIVQFTGATDGFVIDASAAFRIRITLADMVIRTSNAGGLRAIEGDGSLFAISRTVVDNVWIDSTGSGKWASGIFGDNWQSSDFYAVHIEYQNSGLVAGFATGIELQNASNALTFHGLKIQAAVVASPSNRAMQLTNVSDVFVFGGTWQGYFSQSLLFSTASEPHIYGVHFENTNAAPSDGQDVNIIGPSKNASFHGIQGGSFDFGTPAGSVRNCVVSGSEVNALVLGANSASCTIVGTRVTSITDNQTNGTNTLVGNSTGTGAALKNKLVYLEHGNTATIPTVTVGITGATQAYPNGGILYAYDSTNVAQNVFVPMSAVNQTLLSYKPTNALVFRSGLTTVGFFNDTTFTLGTGINFIFPGTVASAGVQRMANNTLIGWRNAANSANLTAGYDASNIFAISGASTVTGAFIGSTSVTTPLYNTSTNCSSSASPAVCSAASAGSVVIAAAATTVVVNTTAVTANSQIILTRDNSLGTKLSVTCNTQTDTALGTPFVSARTAGTSFTITIDTGPTTNPMCISYLIYN